MIWVNIDVAETMQDLQWTDFQGKRNRFQINHLPHGLTMLARG